MKNVITIGMLMLLMACNSKKKNIKYESNEIIRELTAEEKFLESIKDPVYLELAKPYINVLREIKLVNMNNKVEMEKWWESYIVANDCFWSLTSILNSKNTVEEIGALYRLIQKSIFKDEPDLIYFNKFMKYFSPRVVETSSRYDLIIQLDKFCSIKNVETILILQDKFYQKRNANPISKKNYKKYRKKFPREIRRFYEKFKDHPYYNSKQFNSGNK